MLYRPRHVPGAERASSNLPPLELRIQRFLAHFDASSNWLHVVPGAEEPRKVDVDPPQTTGAAIIVRKAEILLGVTMNSARVPMGTMPVLEARGKTATIKHAGGILDKWTYEGLSRDKNQVLQSSTWTLESPSSDSKSLIVVFIASDQEERKSLQLLLEKDPDPVPLPTAGLPSYASSISQHPSSARTSTADAPATTSAPYDILDPNLHVRQHRRRDDKRESVQPWAQGDDGTVKWTPRWSEEEHQALRRVRRGVDSLSPHAPLYSLPPMGGDDDEGKSSRAALDLSQETVHELARHIGSFLRYLDAGLSFRGHGLEDQHIYIGGFTRKHLAVEASPDVESSGGREVLEVLVHLKGVWRRWTRTNDNTLLFTLPGGELDGRGLHVHEVKPHGSDREPDSWTFNSRSGRQLDLTKRVVATAWTLTPGAALHDVGVHDLVYVTFALDEPLKVDKGDVIKSMMHELVDLKQRNAELEESHRIAVRARKSAVERVRELEDVLRLKEGIFDSLERQISLLEKQNTALQLKEAELAALRVEMEEHPVCEGDLLHRYEQLAEIFDLVKDTLSCAVCYEPYQKDEATSLLCGHTFCRTCYTSWEQRSIDAFKLSPVAGQYLGPECPECRTADVRRGRVRIWSLEEVVRLVDRAQREIATKPYVPKFDLPKPVIARELVEREDRLVDVDGDGDQGMPAELPLTPASVGTPAVATIAGAAVELEALEALPVAAVPVDEAPEPQQGREQEAMDEDRADAPPVASPPLPSPSLARAAVPGDAFAINDALPQQMLDAHARSREQARVRALEDEARSALEAQRAREDEEEREAREAREQVLFERRRMPYGQVFR
ncbi:hypothetical protein JCM3775_002121 [Rhodotorula graminis]